MEAIILVLIIGSFACWCAWQCFKPREKSELHKRKEADAWMEDMHSRHKDVKLPLDWSKSVIPSAKSTGRDRVSRSLSNPAPFSSRPRPSPTVVPSATNLSSSAPGVAKKP